MAAAQRKAARARRETAEVRAEREAREEYLGLQGWTRTGSQWSHKGLEFPWPLLDAWRLQDETDNGMHDPAHRALREAQKGT